MNPPATTTLTADIPTGIELFCLGLKVSVGRYHVKHNFTLLNISSEYLNSYTSNMYRIPSRIIFLANFEFSLGSITKKSVKI